MMMAGLAVGSAFMLMWPSIRRSMPGGTPEVGTAESVQMINRRDAIVLDLRSKEDFGAARIPNSRNIPIAELDGRVREIEKFKSRPLIVNLNPGARATAVHAQLTKLGFTQVFALRGGLRAWLEAGLPVEKDA